MADSGETNGSTNGPTAVPGSNIAELFEAALSKTTRQLCYDQTADEFAETQSFMLKGYEYYDLRLYVDTGLSLPKNNERFGHLMPKDDFKAVAVFDKNFHGELEQCWVEIHENCAKYNDEGMPLFKNVTMKIMNFCENASRYIGGEGMLKDGLETIYDNMPNHGELPVHKDLKPEPTPESVEIKPEEGADALHGEGKKKKHHKEKEKKKPKPVVEDERAVKSALGLCGYILDLMKTEAGECAAGCKDLVAKLESFESVSNIDYARISRLDWNFSGDGAPKDEHGGQVLNSTTNEALTKNYMEMLGEATAALSQKIAKENEKKDDLDRDYKISASFAGTGVLWCLVLPPLGFALAITAIAGGTAEAVKAKAAYDDLVKDIKKDNEDLVDILNCAKTFKTVTGQCGNIKSKVQKALSAAKALERTFTQMGADLDSLITQFANISSVLGSGGYTWPTRATVLGKDGHLTKAIPKWKQLQTLAKDFLYNTSLLYAPISQAAGMKEGDPINKDTFKAAELGQLLFS